MKKTVEAAVAPRPPAAPGPTTPRSSFVPLCAGEELYAVEPSAEMTSNMESEVRFAGSLDEARLRAAIGAATAHPMARARLARARFLSRPPTWEIADSVDAGRVLEVARLDEGGDIDAVRAAFCSRPIDLRSAPAFRAMLVRRPGGDSLLLSVHHAISDGIGALRLLNSIARAYAGLPDPAPIDVDPLAVRDNYAFFRRPGERPSPSRRTRGRIARIARVGGVEAPGYGIRSLALSAEEVAGLDPGRFGPEVSLNDLLVAAAHLTIARWNARHGEPCEVVKVLVPVNLRPSAWKAEVVGNVVHLDRNASTPGDRSEPRALVAAVAAQTRRLRDGHSFAASFAYPPWLFWTLTQVVLPMALLMYWRVRKRSRQRATILLSNRGRIETKVGDFGPGPGAITGFWSSPPCTREMGVSIGVVILRGRLLLTLRHRLTHLDADAARAFFDLFRDQLLAIGRAGA